MNFYEKENAKPTGMICQSHYKCENSGCMSGRAKATEWENTVAMQVGVSLTSLTQERDRKVLTDISWMAWVLMLNE